LFENFDNFYLRRTRSNNTKKKEKKIPWVALVLGYNIFESRFLPTTFSYFKNYLRTLTNFISGRTWLKNTKKFPRVAHIVYNVLESRFFTSSYLKKKIVWKTLTIFISGRTRSKNTNKFQRVILVLGYNVLEPQFFPTTLSYFKNCLKTLTIFISGRTRSKQKIPKNFHEKYLLLVLPYDILEPRYFPTTPLYFKKWFSTLTIFISGRTQSKNTQKFLRVLFLGYNIHESRFFASAPSYFENCLNTLTNFISGRMLSFKKKIKSTYSTRPHLQHT